mmetsp:Transcript_13167/g.28790  ORF Transcript_13167/g.28790 Transcript_13167/m.28790 type:complete len:244 (+) Transcript_13167:315-1046(+)
MNRLLSRLSLICFCLFFPVFQCLFHLFVPHSHLTRNDICIIHNLGYVLLDKPVQTVNQCVVNRREYTEIGEGIQALGELCRFRHVALRQVKLYSHVVHDCLQAIQYLLTSLLLSKECRCHLTYCAQNTSMNLHKTNPIHHLIHLPFSRTSREIYQLSHQQLLIFLKHVLEVIIDETSIPIAPSVYSDNLGRIKYLSHAPHQRPVHSHKLLSRYGISFVEYTSNLITIVLTDSINNVLELVTNI